MKLAIKGHQKKGKKVIEILEMLGGINTYNLYGDESYAYYTIDSNNKIKVGIYGFENEQLCHFTLEEFLEKFPYKVGDKVRISEYESEVRIISMNWDGYEVQYEVFTDESEWYSAEELNNWNKEEFMKEPKELLIGFTKDKDGNMVLNTHKDYEIKEVDGKFMLLKKKPQYPKTYEECAKELGYNQVMPKDHILGFKGSLLSFFQQLLICRDAYWKISGEQMGLGKPWEPDWNDCAQHKFGLYTLENEIRCINLQVLKNIILVFPTAEMRDVFYNNFKDLIENCKELL